MMFMCVKDEEDNIIENVIPADILSTSDDVLPHAARSALGSQQATPDELKELTIIQQQMLMEMRLIRQVSRQTVNEEKDVPLQKDKSGLGKQIEISVNVKRVFAVNTIQQRFSATLIVYMRWDMPIGEEPPPPEEDDGDWCPNWTPKFRVIGLLEETHREQSYSVKDDNGNKYIIGEILLMVTIGEQMELKKFPNDCQDLTIVLQCAAPSTQVKLVSPKDGRDAVDINTKSLNLDDFALVKECPMTYNLYLAPYNNSYHSTIKATIKIAREHRFYVVNVGVIMLLICSFILCAWAVHPGDVGARWSVDFSLILTAVAFKLILNDMLPKLSYLTTLDYYVFAGFFFLALATVCHSLLPLFFHGKTAYSPLTLPPLSVDDEQDLIDADMISFWVFLAVWVVWNVSYSGYFMSSRSMEKKAFIKAALETKNAIDGADDEILRKTTIKR